MDNLQKQTVKEMRMAKVGYTEIARKLGLSVNTVKSYCLRNGYNTEALNNNENKCKCCGNIISQPSKTKHRIFCSDKCKQAWWNKHRLEHKSEKIIEQTCSVCGMSFVDYTKSNRKFCSQSCYRKRGLADD